jgi:sensor histidine kinase YesM
MEAIRFGNKFRYQITVDENIDPANVLIPPMLIQPYVENAIWHGLMHKTDDEPGTVELIISGRNGMLYCSIQDNGIGRDKAAEIRAQKPGNRKRSMGMQITMDRIELINKLYNTQTNVEVTDLRDEDGKGIGTRVDLSIPI